MYRIDYTGKIKHTFSRHILFSFTGKNQKNHNVTLLDLTNLVSRFRNSNYLLVDHRQSNLRMKRPLGM